MTSGSVPKISIGLPVYNGDDYLSEAVASLLQQDFDDFELIISDNCSIDGTARQCLALADKDSRIRYSRNQKNIGAAGNFNKVVDMARGSYFVWANHDDVWDARFLRACAAALDDDPSAVLAFPRAAKIDAAGRVVAPLIHDLGLEEAAPAARLRRYHDRFRAIDCCRGWSGEDVEGLWIPVYGLMRREALMRTARIGSYIASDTVLIEELLLHGRFAEVGETLFYKRDYPGRSMRASVAYASRHTWFTGGRSRRFIFPRHRALAGRVGAVLRAPLSLPGRLACAGEMLGFYVRRPAEGKALVKELLINASFLLPRAARASRVPERW